MPVGQRRCLRNLLVSVFTSYTVCIGATSYFYDSKNNDYRRNYLTRGLALMVNIVTIVLLPIVLWDSLQMLDAQFWTPLLTATGKVGAVVYGLHIICAAMHRHWRDRAEYEIFLDVKYIHQQHLKYFPLRRSVRKRFYNLLLWRCIFAIYGFFTSAICTNLLLSKRSFYTILLNFLFNNVDNILYTTLFAYFFGMWYICRALCVINSQLLQCWQELKLLCSIERRYLEQQFVLKLSDKVQLLLRIHWELLRLVKRLHKLYSFYLLATRFTCSVWSIIFGFTGIVFMMRNGDVSIWCSGFLLFSIIISLSTNLYYTDLVASLIVEAQQDTADILRGISELPLNCQNFYKTCELFGLQVCSFRLEVDLCGLFFLNKELTFSGITAIICYIVVLIQFYLTLGENNLKK